MVSNHAIRILCTVMLAGCPPAARADLYRYLDPSTGWLVYSNQRLSLPLAPVDFERSTYRTVQVTPEKPPHESEGRKPQQARPKPVMAADFPSVTTAAQRSRDSERRRILQEELDAEQAALASAVEKRAAADTIRRHETNIAALQREIANTK